jgi:hypothetical protein
MKVTHKLGDMGGMAKLMSMPEGGEGEELPPSLMLSHLPGPIEGMPEKGDFHAHIKGKVRAHHVVTKDGKTHHNYDLDVHHVEAQKKPATKKPEKKEKSVEEAFKEYGPKG